MRASAAAGRWILIAAVAVTGCGDPGGGSSAAAADGRASDDPGDGSFELVADIQIESNIDSILCSGHTFVPGDHITLDMKYASYADAAPLSGPPTVKGPVLEVTRGTATVEVDYSASCTVQYGVPYRETDDASIDWEPAATYPTFGLDGMCETPTMTFRFSN